MKNYKCLFNHELLIAGTSESPYQSYSDDISDRYVEELIRELKDTDVDVIMLCPTAWRRKLWYSEVERHWQDAAPNIPEPSPGYDYKYYEKAYYRWRRYMLKGKDPVELSVKTSHDIGKAVFASYRMNDNHYIWDESCPTHDAFWKEHPEFRINEGDVQWSGKGCLNYIHSEVREYYYSILEELIANYDFDGLELDLMRNCCLFEKKDVKAGISIMTEFVERIHNMLCTYSKKKGKYLPLCVRVPYKLDACLESGLDIETWDKSGFVDMINMSSHYVLDMHYEPEKFKQKIKNSKIYGEMHFIVSSGGLDNGFANNVSRKTGREMYRTAEYNLLFRGCDGLSFFNFDYARNHAMGEPRRAEIKDNEPPFKVLKNIAAETLKDEPKHYYERVDKVNYADIDFFVADNTKNTAFKKAIVKINTAEKLLHHNIKVFLNDIELCETRWMGELFVPQSNEALPNASYTRFYDVPLNAVIQGMNKAILRNEKDRSCMLDITFAQFEMALYTDKYLWE